ncbi:acyltransferase [Butyrivibrio sp. AD3002]|uniref:acyltransferase n=1 Tax=Butyrivibrio sp. AD3002 TaxID=1280670 RepID=UPI0003B5C7DE|nr:acyltransferase [Butyrivibrio sp. AD3002]
MKIINALKKKISGRMSSEEYSAYLRGKGATIGKTTVFIDPKQTHVDEQAAFLIFIGDYCTITAGVTILAHDYSFSVLNNTYGIMPQNHRQTKIGNNVFVGRGATILMGAEIGDNCIIGAGAVVSGKVPDNTVWAGNPAKQISTLDAFKEKRAKYYEDGAITLAKGIITRLGRKPTYEEMGAYIGLFAPRTEEFRKYFEALSKRYETVADNVWNMEKKYIDLDDFLEKNHLI